MRTQMLPTETPYGIQLPIIQTADYLQNRQWLIETREDVLEHSKIKNMNEQWKRAYENLADALDIIDAMIARTEGIGFPDINNQNK